MIHLDLTGGTSDSCTGPPVLESVCAVYGSESRGIPNRLETAHRSAVWRKQQELAPIFDGQFAERKGIWTLLRRTKVKISFNCSCAITRVVLWHQIIMFYPFALLIGVSAAIFGDDPTESTKRYRNEQSQTSLLFIVFGRMHRKLEN